MVAFFSNDGRLFACHQNVAILYDRYTLPSNFETNQIYIAYDPNKFGGSLLKRIVDFARTQVSDEKIFIFDNITHHACGFGTDGKFYRLNTNVAFSRISLAPTSDTQRNVLCGIRIYDFDKRREYNNNDNNNRTFDVQFNTTDFVQHKNQKFDLTKVIAPQRDERSSYSIHEATHDISLASRADEIERLVQCPKTSILPRLFNKIQNWF